MRRFPLPPGALLCFCLLARPAYSAVQTFGAEADTGPYIEEPDRIINFSFIGYENRGLNLGTQAGVIRFDLSSLSNGLLESANDATVTIEPRTDFASNFNFDGQTLDLYIMSASNVDWEDGDASWNHKDQSAQIPWQGGAGPVGDAVKVATTTIPGNIGESTSTGPVELVIPKAVINDLLDAGGVFSVLIKSDSLEANPPGTFGEGFAGIIFNPQEFGTPPGPTITLDVVPIDNDSCADALSIPEGTITGSTASATNDGSATCGNSNASPDVWYAFTPPAAGTFNVNTCDSSFDTEITVYSGTCGTLSELACNAECPDEPCGSPHACVSLPVEGGTSYLIRISGAAGASGEFTLNASMDFPVPGNDSCGTATPISDGTTAGTTLGASNDGVANCGNSGASPDVWYEYTATCTGALLADSCSSSFDTVISVHEGSGGTAPMFTDGFEGVPTGANPDNGALPGFWSLILEQAEGEFEALADSGPYVEAPDRVINLGFIGYEDRGLHLGTQAGLTRFDLTGAQPAAGDATFVLTPRTDFSSNSFFDAQTLDLYLMDPANFDWQDGDVSWNHKVKSAGTSWANDAGPVGGAVKIGSATHPGSLGGSTQHQTMSILIPQATLSDWISTYGVFSLLVKSDSLESNPPHTFGAPYAGVVWTSEEVSPAASGPKIVYTPTATPLVEVVDAPVPGPVAGSQYLKLQNGSAYAFAQFESPVSAGELAAEAHVYIPAQTPIQAIHAMAIKSGTSTGFADDLVRIASWHVSGTPEVRYFDGTAWETIMTGSGAAPLAWEEDVWQKWRIDLDLDADTFTVSVGGATSDPLPAKGGTASQLLLQTHEGDRLFYADEVSVLFDSGPCPGDLVCNNNCGGEPCGGSASCVSAAVNVGEKRLIRVAGAGGATGEFSLQVSCVPSPANDSCAEAAPIADGTTSGNLAGATNDGVSSCGPADTPDLWFAYTAPVTGTVSLDSCGSTTDTVLSVHTGCPGTSANEVAGACNDDCAGTPCILPNSCLSAAITKGQLYYFRLASTSGTGAYVLNVASVKSCSDPVFDGDQDGDVDQVDFAELQRCFTGESENLADGCTCFDRDTDGSADGKITNADFLAFENCASGPDVAADPDCD